MFGSPQCLGYNFEHGKVTSDLCFPSDKQIISKLQQIAKESSIKHIYIASDSQKSERIKKFQKLLSKKVSDCIKNKHISQQ